MAAIRTVRDLVTRALRVAGVTGSGETPSADDAADALLSMNQMLDAWQAERLYCYAIIDRSQALIAGDGEMTIGPGGEFNAPRPIKIEYAYTRDSQNFDRSLVIVQDPAYYAQLTLKSLGNSYPSLLYYRPHYPFGRIFLWQLPIAGLTLWIGTWEVLEEFTSLNTVASYPAGYEDAIVYSLAERISVEYDKNPSAGLQKMAAQARANIKQNNLISPQVATDEVMLAIDGESAAYFAAGGP